MIVQVPEIPVRVTVVPETVQMLVVADAKVTASPEEAVALIENGGFVISLPASVLKVMVWFALLMVNVELLEVPLVLDTVIVALPPAAMLLAKIDAVTCVLLTKVEVCALPFQFTVVGLT